MLIIALAFNFCARFVIPTISDANINNGCTMFFQPLSNNTYYGLMHCECMCVYNLSFIHEQTFPLFLGTSRQTKKDSSPSCQPTGSNFIHRRTNLGFSTGFLVCAMCVEEEAGKPQDKQDKQILK